MYSLSGYGRMIADRVRTDAYCEALRRSIRPGHVVLEIGTGIGFFAVLSHQLGARRVIAVEPDASIQVAREVARANHCEAAIEFIEDRSDRITLEEPADVVVSDLRGILPLLTAHIPSIVDARVRHLAPQGILIPQRDTIRGAVVEAPIAYEETVGIWSQSPHGIDLSAGRRLVVNSMRKVAITGDQLLSDAACLTTIDYRQVTNADFVADVTWRATRDGTAHGYCLWFDTDLVPDVGFSNAPGEPEAIYGKMFFPLTEPIELKVGDELACRFEARLIDEEYIWRWDSTLPKKFARAPNAQTTNFVQSTFLGTLSSLDRLRRRSADYSCTLSEDGLIDREILQLMTGKLTSGQLAAQLLERFPQRFASSREALTRVTQLAERYGT